MIRKARLWIGITLFIILAFNYAIIGFPLYRKAASLNDSSTTLLMKKIKSGNVLKSGEDEYILEIFRREKASIDRRLLVLNCAAISIVVVLASWTVFGLILHRRER